MNADDSIGALREEAKSLGSSIFYTEKAHFRHEARGRSAHFWLGVISTVSGTLAAAAILRQLGPEIPTALSLLTTACSGVLTFVKPAENAGVHASNARDLGALRVRLRQFRKIDLAGSQVNAISARKTLASITEEKASIDRSAAPISDRIYDKVVKRFPEPELD